MSWKSVKNLLIVLLILVNSLLAVFAYNYYIASRFTDANTVNNSLDILKAHGLEVSGELISVKNESADILYSAYDRENYVCLVASLLFGKEADGMYMLPSGVRAETADGEVALIGYDMSLEYASVSEEGVENAVALAKAAAEDVAKEACLFLEEKIALPKGSISTGDCTASGDIVFVNVVQKENGLPLYGMECVFGIKGEKIVYASGKHFFGVPEKAENAQLLDRINILFSEKDDGMTGKLLDISLCYTLYEADGEMMFVPSYTLTYADGNVRAVNAISKKLY